MFRKHACRQYTKRRDRGMNSNLKALIYYRREMFTVSFERADSILKNAETFVAKVREQFEEA